VCDKLASLAEGFSANGKVSLNWLSHPRGQAHSASLRNEIEELREEAAALADRAKKTARQAEVLASRIKDLEKEVAKRY
jgi:predicted nuclease with TOPRIM domain